MQLANLEWVLFVIAAKTAEATADKSMWTFDISWFLTGIAVIIGGALVIIFHKWIGDTFAAGINSYNKIKLFGLIGIGVGLLFMTNLHTTLLRFIFHLIAPSKF